LLRKGLPAVSVVSIHHSVVSIHQQIHQEMKFKGIFMRRSGVCLVAMLLVAGTLHTASAQTTPAPAAAAAPAAPDAKPSDAKPSDAKPSRMKLTAEKLKEMRASWKANKPKLKACRKDVKAKGLSGDDRWFYIEDCMNKT
jgi:hypothetical protein